VCVCLYDISENAYTIVNVKALYIWYLKEKLKENTLCGEKEKAQRKSIYIYIYVYYTVIDKKFYFVKSR